MRWMGIGRHGAIGDSGSMRGAFDHGSVLGMRMLLLVTCVCVFVPFVPQMPGISLDDSWRYAMNQIVAQDIPIGRSIIFTFGPYASIYTTMYHPGTDRLMMLGCAYLAFAYGVGLLVVTWNASRLWMLALCVVLAGPMYSRDSLLLCYPLIVILVSIRLCERSNAGQRPAPWQAALVFSVLGLLPLIKGTLLVVCGTVLVLSVFYFLRRGQRTLAFIALLSSILSCVLLWMASGQAMTDFVPYLLNVFPTASGYTEAMAVEGALPEIVSYLIPAAFLLLAAWKLPELPSTARLFLGLSLFVLLFLTFKNGFVRHDAHVVIASTFILLASTILIGAMPSRLMAVATLVTLAGWIYLDSQYNRTSTADLVSRVESTFRTALAGARKRLGDRNWPKSAFDTVNQSIRTVSPIASLEGTTDIYSYDQSALLASGNRWTPRPVFQSYAAYNFVLAESNRRFVASDAAPDNIVLSLQPIDAHMPSLEDGASWPVFLERYRPSRIDGERLYLKKKSEPYVAKAESWSPPESHGFGSSVVPPPADGLIVASMTFKPTLLGRVASFAFRTGQIWIEVRLDDGTSREYRIISGSAAAGFLLSPIVENAADFGLLYANDALLGSKKVKSFVITRKTGSPFLWADDYEIRYRRLAPVENADLSTILKLEPLVEPGASRSTSSRARCDGAIDAVNGSSPSKKPLSTKRFLKVEGWLAASVAQARLADKVFVVLTDQDKHVRYVQTHGVARSDVATYFGKPALNDVGYSTLVDLRGIPGSYDIGLAFEDGGQIIGCSQFGFPLSVNP